MYPIYIIFCTHTAVKTQVCRWGITGPFSFIPVCVFWFWFFFSWCGEYCTTILYLTKY